MKKSTIHYIVILLILIVCFTACASTKPDTKGLVLHSTSTLTSTGDRVAVYGSEGITFRSIEFIDSEGELVKIGIDHPEDGVTERDNLKEIMDIVLKLASLSHDVNINVDKLREDTFASISNLLNISNEAHIDIDKLRDAINDTISKIRSTLSDRIEIEFEVKERPR
jgi:hypothetical protein